MNALIIDDHVFKGFKSTYEVAADFFKNLGGSTYFSEWPNEALAKLEEKEGDTKISDKIDLAIIDYDFGSDEITGEELGGLISEKYPHIAMVILTGAGDVAKRYERCQSVLRKGFIDFRDKADFGGFTKDIHSILNEIISLPSFKAKQDHKKSIDSLEIYLKEDAERRNKLMKKGFLGQFEEKVKSFRYKKIRVTVEKKLDFQEQILQMVYTSTGSYDKINCHSLSGAIQLLCDEKEINTSIINELRSPKEHQKYGLPWKEKETNTVYNTLKMYFGMYESGFLTNKALITMGLLKNYPEKYSHTLKVARTERLFTLVNDIVLEMDKPL